MIRESGAESKPFYRSSGLKPTKLLDRNTGAARSEEHTSELQSRSDIVCRLLLEKKTNTRMCLEPIVCPRIPVSRPHLSSFNRRARRSRAEGLSVLLYFKRASPLRLTTDALEAPA